MAAGEAVGLGDAAGALAGTSGVLVVAAFALGVALVAGVLLTRGAGADDVVLPGVLIVTFVVLEPPEGVLRVVELFEELFEELLVVRGAGMVRVVLVVVLRSVVVDVPGTTIVRLTTLGDGAITTTLGVGVGDASVLTIVVVDVTSGLRVA